MLYPKLVRGVLQPLVLWRAGEGSQRRYLREFERTQFWTAEQLRDLQWKRLRGLLDHAYRQCPFYRQRFDRLGLLPADIRKLEDLSLLPILEKQDIQEHRDQMVALDWPAADLIANQTGGSTGCPLSFYLSRDRKCSRAAATIRHNRWAGWEVGDKTALLWGAPQDVPASRWRARMRNWLLDRQLFFDAGHVTEDRLLEFHHALLRFRPRVILAYAGAAALYARFVKDRGLTPYQPRSIVTSAEVLDDDNRMLLEEVFGCEVFNRYGCREVSVLASECPAHEGLHTMAEGIYLEIIRDGKPARPGEMGALVVTDLLNAAMPLIRYRIGDVAAWAPGHCSCGRGLPRLQQVTGRASDFLTGADGRLVSGLFLSIYLVGQRPSLGQVQIHQERAGQVLFKIKPGPGFQRQADVDYLERTIRRYLGQATVVTHELVKSIPHQPSGKFLFCRSSVPAEFGRPAAAMPA